MSGRESKRGMVLIGVLWAIAFCSVLAMAAAASFRGLAGVVAIDRDRVQADALLSAGLEAGAGVVGSMQDAPLTDREVTIELSTGGVRIRMHDEAGRIDIGKAPVELLAALLRHAGADDDDATAVAQRIIAQRGPVQQPSPLKASKPDTSAAKPDASAAKSDAAAASPVMFTDVRQLARIPGMTREWMAAMTPLITVFGSDTINPLTAPVAVIEALPFFDEGRLDAFLAMRRGPLPDPERLAFLVGPAQKYLKVQTRGVVGLDLMARTTDGYQAVAQAFIVLLPGDKQPYRVLAWNPMPPLPDTDAAAQWEPH
jgi:general secretion pathway protein K